MKGCDPLRASGLPLVTLRAMGIPSRTSHPAWQSVSSEPGVDMPVVLPQQQHHQIAQLLLSHVVAAWQGA